MRCDGIPALNGQDADRMYASRTHAAFLLTGINGQNGTPDVDSNTRVQDIAGCDVVMSPAVSADESSARRFPAHELYRQA